MKNISGLLLLTVFSLYSFTTPTLEQDDKKNIQEVIAVDPTTEIAIEGTLVAAEEEEFDAVAIVSEETRASYYHDKFNGKKTASGELFDNSKLTAAHKTLPFGTKV